MPIYERPPQTIYGFVRITIYPSVIQNPATTDTISKGGGADDIEADGGSTYDDRPPLMLQGNNGGTPKGATRRCPFKGWRRDTAGGAKADELAAVIHFALRPRDASQPVRER